MNIRLLTAVFWIIILLSYQKVASQGFCGNTGGFAVTPTQGCAPLTVKVQNQVPKAENIAYAFQFDRAQTTAPTAGQVSTDSSYTYNLPGTYTILQFGSAGGTGFSQCKDVKVLETRAPDATLIVCPDGKVRLTVFSDSISNAYDRVEVNWGDGRAETINPKDGQLHLEHTYPAGSKIPAIKVQGKYDNGVCQQNTAIKTITEGTKQSLASIAIKSVEMLASGDARILYNGMEGVRTELLIDKGDGQFVSTGKTGQTEGTQAITISGLNAAQLYRFQLRSLDICNNPVDSPVVSSMVIREGTYSLDEIISLSWEHYPNSEALLEYQVKRDGAVIHTTPDQPSYLDTDVKCGNTYKYEIVAIIANDVRSYSAPISISPKTSSPGLITNAVVSVEGENNITTKVDLTGEGLTSSYNLIIERAPAGSGAFQVVSPAENQTLQWSDTDVNTSERAYCYRFQYENACKVKSPDFSTPVCSVLLSNSAPEVKWTPATPFIQPVTFYDLQQLDDQGNVVQTVPKQLETAHQLDLNAQSGFSFRIEANSADGLKSYSNILQFRSDPILLVPDAFTPNGDAYNERFEVKAYFLSGFKLSVFSRWGDVVFHSNDISDSWDGKIKGENAPGGYYLYKIEGTDTAGRGVSRNGSFLLIR